VRLKLGLRRAGAWGYLKENPAKAVRKAKEPPGRMRYLTPEERAALLDVASDPLRPLIIAALQTGARRSELLNLRWGDVDIRGRTVTFRRTKNGDRRVVPLTETLADTLRALSASRISQSTTCGTMPPARCRWRASPSGP